MRCKPLAVREPSDPNCDSTADAGSLESHRRSESEPESRQWRSTGECDAGRVQLDEDVATVLGTFWGMRQTVAASKYQTSRSRTVWRISTGSGDLSIKVDRHPHVSVVGGVSVQEHVATHRPGLAPHPVPTVDGDLAVTVDGCRFTVSEWISGRQPIAESTSWAWVGAAAAALHGLPAAIRDFALPLDQVGEELRRQPGWPAGLVLETVERARHVGAAPSAVVHGQLNVANVVELLDGGVAVLDWDEAGTGLSAIDLGYPLICEFLSEDLTWHSDLAESFFRGYQEAATTPLPEADDVIAIGLLLGLRSAMFANQATRLTRVQHAIEHEPEIRQSISW